MRRPDREVRLDCPPHIDMFERTAGAFLREREAENCVMLGLCSQMRAGAMSIQNTTPYFGVLRSDDAVVGAALVAGFLVLLSSPIEDAALPLLVADIARAAPDVPGVVADVSAGRRFAELWTASTGRAHRLNMSERIFRLERVSPPPPVAGEMRLAAEADHELLTEWLTEFNAEALGQSSQAAAMHAFAARWIARQGRAMYLWVVAGRPVSMVGVSGQTPNGIRVAPVYTPRGLRGRGYASALTAAATQEQLDNGKRYCFLFTDLANPTSNHIYQAIGYRSVSDVADYRFEPPGGRDLSAEAPQVVGEKVDDPFVFRKTMKFSLVTRETDKPGRSYALLSDPGPIATAHPSLLRKCHRKLDSCGIARTVSRPALAIPALRSTRGQRRSDVNASRADRPRSRLQPQNPATGAGLGGEERKGWEVSFSPVPAVDDDDRGAS